MHISLLLQNVLVYWPPSGCFSFTVRTAVVRYTLAKVQLVNLHLNKKLVDNYVDYIRFVALSLSVVMFNFK
jgi:hypothetical protein